MYLFWSLFGKKKFKHGDPVCYLCMPSVCKALLIARAPSSGDVSEHPLVKVIIFLLDFLSIPLLDAMITHEAILCVLSFCNTKLGTLCL